MKPTEGVVITEENTINQQGMGEYGRGASFSHRNQRVPNWQPRDKPGNLPDQVQRVPEDSGGN